MILSSALRVHGRRVWPGFAVLAVALTGLALVQPWAALVYLLASVLTFAAFAIDKAAARRGSRRTPERVLYALAFAGGWPGALLAQQVLRHKSAKPAFTLRLWLSIGAHVAVCATLAGLLGSAVG